ncbi:helix-turn-helix domain-containing protein [Corynebacterium vitaeruminis]|uniref:helix-turn-helix domain-containing protein n=2 Tax=Corynebacterium vitaeruminis TaxID=38305 RepID=UPI0028AF170C|nr:helix-turn-helix domain-containing protein [Corynebacterium vitaeruminis]
MYANHVILFGMSETKWNGTKEMEWVSPAEAAALIPGSPKPATIRKWLRAGKLKGAIQLPGGHWQIPVSAIQEILGGSYEQA